MCMSLSDLSRPLPVSRSSLTLTQVAYKECHIYDSFLKAGKPEIRVEYENSVRTCPAKESGVTFSVYSSYTIDSKTITLDC